MGGEPRTGKVMSNAKETKRIGDAERVGQEVESKADGASKAAVEQSVVPKAEEVKIGQTVFYRRSKNEVCPAMVVAVRANNVVTLFYWCEAIPNFQPQEKGVKLGCAVGQYCLSEDVMRAAIAYEQAINKQRNPVPA